MKQNWHVALCAGAMLLGLATTAQAALIDRGNGMIYDSDQELTWLQDANYAKTSGYDADGQMTWGQAMTWASNLSYGGYNDWRLPSVTDNGNDGCNFGWSGTDCGYNVDTSGSELAYMWYEILGNISVYDTSGNIFQPGWGLTSTSADGVDILNLQSLAYWSGTECPSCTNSAWGFDTSSGGQSDYTKNNSGMYAWAVRSGDVSAVPVPAAVWLFGSGLIGLLGVARRQR